MRDRMTITGLRSVDTSSSRGVQTAARDSTTPAVSVVIPTHSRADLLARCLEALRAQDLDSSTYEILVVDDAADETTRTLIAEVAERAGPNGPVVRYLVNVRAQGPAASRNLGWRSARAPIVAFTDDDCVPDRGWLREGLAALHDGIAAVSGRIVVPLDARPTDYERNAAGLADAVFATANCMCRRDALQRVGGYDERYLAAWREDSDLQFALEQANLTISHAPDAIVMHPVRPASWGVSLQQQRKSMFNALLYKKFPHRYRAQIQPTPPLRYYAIVCSLLLGFALCRRSDRAALASLLVWGTLTGTFCARRLRGNSRSPSHLAEIVVTSVGIPPLAVYWRLRGAVKFRVVFF
jgi:cellulose synthase/poly-beta-1,6-N-acetylglucosamine synthase-like glycosyltransferase